MRSEDPTTLKTYHFIYEEMKWFSVIIKDFQSAAILDRKLCAGKAWPVKPETLAMYLYWKSSLPDRQLTFKGVPINDLNGNPLKCTGHWKAPTCVPYALVQIGN